MSLELDHLFLMTEQNAPAAERLIQFGLAEGSPNEHPGQGTANRRFFFQNLFLELLWVSSSAEAQSPLAMPTGLWDRWSGRDAGASPFGICFRARASQPVGQIGSEDTSRTGGLPFVAWDYRPPYLPAPLAIQMSERCAIVAEPLLFFIGFGRRPDSDTAERRQPLEHACGLRKVTRATVHSRSFGKMHEQFRAAQTACAALRFEAGSEEQLELGFDDETQGQSVDFRPALPLMFCW